MTERLNSTSTGNVRPGILNIGTYEATTINIIIYNNNNNSKESIPCQRSPKTSRHPESRR